MTTPIRRQYLSIKRQYPDIIVFFRMGDFYETFDDDAALVAEVLGLTLTSREMGRGNRVPMAGVPYHAAEGYIARLLSAGHKVAIAEQMDKPNGRDLVDRQVTSVVTPGTVTDPAFVKGSGNTYIVALVSDGERAGLAYADAGTGEFATTRLGSGDDTEEAVRRELLRLSPAEIVTRGDEPLLACLPDAVTRSIERNETWRLDDATAVLCEHFSVASLEGFGCAGEPLAVRAAGALLAYLQGTQRNSLKQITSLSTYSTSRFMSLDAQTRRNLELLESSSRGDGPTLFKTIDATRTPLGARLLRQWVNQPLLIQRDIEQRHDGVEWFCNDALARARVRETLRGVGDIERVINRVVNRQAGPREIAALGRSLAKLPELSALLRRDDIPALIGTIPVARQAADEIERAIADEPPTLLSQGGAIRPGYSAELDGLRATLSNDRAYIANLESRERERTGIRSMKVGYNKVFGYYIEITQANAALVPADYIRKQTLVNAERYITPELKEYEALVLNAEERILELEGQLYRQVLGQVADAAVRLLAAARGIAELDVSTALAEAAAAHRYVRPVIADDGVIDIKDGRHPVVERLLQGDPFTPNDTYLTPDESIVVLTGPNMSGKSTWIRQVALITLLAQIGSFVPADAARIGLVDRIFTRIGASDEIARGQSTFMVEMVETANILHHATHRSLLILDEIGRGTSTYDGLAIAWAVVEYIHNHPELRAKTLFATHYHELTDLAERLPHVVNYSVAVAEQGDSVVFLHKIVPGAADRSYGVHVARLAGLPRPVVARAQEILADLEQRVSARGVCRLTGSRPEATRVIAAEPGRYFRH
jgi:DNA mismatch repair protein MutS